MADVPRHGVAPAPGDARIARGERESRYMASERGDQDPPAVVTKQLFPDRRHATDPGEERPWSLDDLPVAVLILRGSEVLAVNEQWTTLTGLDLASSKGDGWLTAARREDRAAVRRFPVRRSAATTP